MTDRRLRDIWDSLQNKKPQMPHFLEKIALTDTGIHGVYDFQVEFKYPVSVLAGGNGSGKSTVLFTAYSAYTVPDTRKGARSRSSEKRSSQGFSPFTVFPDYRLKPGEPEDKESISTVLFEYLTPNGQRFTQLQCLLKVSSDLTQKHNVGYNHSGDIPPERSVYLITPKNFTYPYEINKFPDIPNKVIEIQKAHFRPSQMEFAQQLLPFKYSKAFDLNHPNFNFSNSTNLLVVEQENGVIYPETHMATGERAIFRLSQKIAHAKGGLVLIDEVETSLHPSLQKSLMLELQQLALRNNLQIIVTTHSPAVLDSVPPIGRIFLDRNEEGNISVHPPYLDLVQDALYGRSDKKFNLLCEDNAAKSILEGVVDTIMCNSHLRAKRESCNIEYTEDGASQFPMYAQVLEQFGQNIIFVLDGDQRDEGVVQEIHSRIQKMQNRLQNTQNSAQQTEDSAKHPEQVMFLPGAGAPEEWVWERVRAHPDDFAAEFGLDVRDLVQQIKRRDADYDSASDSPSDIAKAKIYDLSQVVNRSVPDICRIVSRLEAKREESDIQLLVKQLKDAFQTWREGA